MLVALCALAPLGLAGRIRLGLGQSHVHSVWDAVTSVLTFTGMLLTARLGGGVTMVVLAAASAPLITLAGNWAQLLRKQRWLTPRWRDANWPEFARLLHEGGSFFFIALFGAAAFGCDSLIVVFTLGARAAAEPMIALRLAAALQTLMAGMLLPYWPRLSRVAAGSVAARNRALRQTFGFIFLISTTAAGGLLLFGPAVVRLWTGGAVGLAAGLAFPIAVWIFVFGVAQGLLMVFSVAHLVRTQLTVAAASGVLILLCKIGGAIVGGASGLVWGGTLALLSGAVVPLIVLLARDLRRQEG
jgi:O-antigen/teichoic acid export membrane protein